MILGAIEILLLIIIGLPLYFVPSIIAFSRGASSATGIFLLNLLLGWTALGWIAAFVWSLSAPKRQIMVVTSNNYNNQNTQIISNTAQQQTQPNLSQKGGYDQKLETLQKLKQMLDNGILSQEEFDKEKNKILAD